MPTTRIETPDAAGVLFTPRDHPGPLPLVVFGHGSHTGKDDPMMQALCSGFRRGVPAAVLCIDAPGHGERRELGVSDEAFDERVRTGMGDAAIHDQYVRDWTAAASAARAAAPAIDGRTAYVGFSMGAVFGLSIVHRLDFVGPAVFALGGLRDPDGGAGHRAQNELIRAGAAELGDREVLMLNMTHDESFPIDGALEAFAIVPGPKRMMLYQGGHVDIPREAVDLACTFLAGALTKSG